MVQPDDPPYPTPDHQADHPGDARWMTFAELATARGISKLSAAALVRRHGWRRQRDNRGRVIALVPRDGPELRRIVEADHRPDNPSDDPPDIAALEDAVVALRERAEAAERRAEAAEADRRRAEERADTADADRRAAAAMMDSFAARTDQAEAAIAGERQRTDALRDRLDRLQHDLDAARAQAQDATRTVEALRREDDTRKARGLMARLRAAWREG